MTAALGLAWSLVPARAAGGAASASPIALFPLARSTAGRASTATLQRGIERILGADDYLSGLYSRPGEAETVDLFLSWYGSQTEGHAIHSPEVCLPGAGWEVAAHRAGDGGAARHRGPAR